MVRELREMHTVTRSSQYDRAHGSERAGARVSDDKEPELRRGWEKGTTEIPDS